MFTVTWRVSPSCLLTAGSGMTVRRTQPLFCLISGQSWFQLDGGKGCGLLSRSLGSTLSLTLADARSCWGTFKTPCPQLKAKQTRKKKKNAASSKDGEISASHSGILASMLIFQMPKHRLWNPLDCMSAPVRLEWPKNPLTQHFPNILPHLRSPMARVINNNQIIINY